MSEKTNTEETLDTSEQSYAASETETSSAELTVQDLAAIKQIIDVASTRGAFKPTEMVAVGQTYSKLETFLNAISTQQGE